MNNKNPLRILHVLGNLNRGGAETMVMNVYRNIDKNKIQFDFVVHTLDKGDYSDEISALGGNIFHIPKYRGVNHLNYVLSWNRFFQEHGEYAIIHGHVRSTAAIYLKIAKKYNRKAIAHSHSTSSGVGSISIIKKLYQIPIRFIADYFLACSVDAGTWLFGNAIINSESFKVINNGIDLEEFYFSEDTRYNMRVKMGLQDKIVIGHVGSFSYAKNHDFLIDIFFEFKKNTPNAVLLLVGEGLFEKEIKEKVDKLNLINDVIFYGLSDNVSSLMMAMDLFLFPSHYEGLGIVLVEAQAVGLKCLVSDSIPKEVRVSDIVDYMPLNDAPQVWVLQLNELLAHSIDRLSYVSVIKKSGYDINETSVALIDTYMLLLDSLRYRNSVL